jgi:hypothetical protein
MFNLKSSNKKITPNENSKNLIEQTQNSVTIINIFSVPLNTSKFGQEHEHGN